MDSPLLGVALLLASVGVAVLWSYCGRGRGRFGTAPKLPLPPGPPGEFLLGHYRVVPTDAAFKQYAKWGKEYDSDILYFENFGSKRIVLNSLEAAVELLDKRGSNYSDRPRFVMFEEMGWSPTLTWLRWGPKYQLHRRVLQPPFAKSNVGQYAAMQRREALICCRTMIDDPTNWVRAVRKFSVAIVLKIAYGIDVEGLDSPWIKLAEDAAKAIGRSGPAASSIMDLFPATRYLPDWLPFMERLRYARTWRSTIESISSLPFEAARTAMKVKLDTSSLAHQRLSIYEQNAAKGLPNDFDLEDIKGASAAVLIAGNDTTAATVMLLILYLMQNPAAQRTAQAELDREVGHDRLPTWEDLPRLQYLRLFLHETYRANPLSPLGIPHASVHADDYAGFRIPAGTVVYPNVWAMHHDERVYTDPTCFVPERYLPTKEGGRGEPLPVGNFGFGRRICVGKNLAENSLLIILATILATIDVDWPAGPDGRPTPFEPEWSFRGQAVVLPFKASITSRSKQAEGLLDAALEASRVAR